MWGKITIRTDHAFPQWFFRFRNPEGQLARWMEKWQYYDFPVTDRSGHKCGNAFPDGLVGKLFANNAPSSRARNSLLKGMGVSLSFSNLQRCPCSWFIHWKNGNGDEAWTSEQLKTSQ